MKRQMTLTEKILRDAGITEEITELLKPIPDDTPTPWRDDPNENSLEVISEALTITNNNWFVPVELLGTDKNGTATGVMVSDVLSYCFSRVGDNAEYRVSVPRLKQLLLDDNAYPRFRNDLGGRSSIYTMVDMNKLVNSGLAKRVIIR